MLLTISDLIKLLRDSVNIQSDEEEKKDGYFLQMSDKDLELYIKWGVTRAFPEINDLAFLSQGSEYPIILLAKIELYTKLAVLRADKVDLGADNNNYIKQDQRFTHYMKLIDSAKKEYEDWLNNEGLGFVNSYDVLLSSRHYTIRNYEKQKTPEVRIKIDLITKDSIEFRWLLNKSSFFGRYNIYISELPIVDIYKTGGSYKNKINEGAVLIKEIVNIRDTFLRLENLKNNTKYYLAVFEIERNSVFGYSEISFTTLEN